MSAAPFRIMPGLVVDHLRLHNNPDETIALGEIVVRFDVPMTLLFIVVRFVCSLFRSDLLDLDLLQDIAFEVARTAEEPDL